MRKSRDKILLRTFYARHPETVARNLLGKKLVRFLEGKEVSGMVTETEAYLSRNDSACHAYRGETPRNRVMFGKVGIAYVYFIYGMYNMLNVVTEREGLASAVLLRGLEPMEGIDIMKNLRKNSVKNLADGPGKLCQALAIDRSLNGWDITLGEKLWFEEFLQIPAKYIQTGPRIGIQYATPRDREAHRRFWVDPEFLRKNQPTEKFKNQ